MTKPTATPKPALPAFPPNDAPVAKWALWCAEVGRITGAWKVFPCVPGKKRPLHKGWQGEAACDPKTVQTMWLNDPEANIGLAIQPGFIAIDGDLYKPGAEAALAAFEAEHGELPRTLETCTARGGLHLIYSTTKTFGNSTGTLPDFGDVRGHGGLIVGPGSIFEGNRYTVENLSLPIALPAHIEARLCESTRRDRSKPDEPVRFVVVDDSGNVQAFTDWCAGKSVRTIATPNGEVASPCIENQGGNNTLAATGAMAHDYGLSEDVALEIALEHHNPRCEPPWEGDDYERHFRSGYRSATGQLGSRAPSRDYRSLFTAQPKIDPSPELPRGATRAFYYLGMLDAIPEPTWIIDGVLPKGGYALLYGKRSTKKSFATLDMGLSIATGTHYHGREVKQGRVVYFAGEGFRGINRRVKAWFNTRKLSRENYARDFALVPFTSKWDTLRGCDLVRQVLRDIAKDGAISHVMIDTARRSMSGDENSPTSVGQFLDGVSDVCGEFGCGYIIVHHAGKDESKGARGGGPFEDDADTVLHFTKGPGGAVHMRCTKQKDDEADWTMKFRADTIALGSEPNGKPITSLALTLVSESKGEDDESSPATSERDQYAGHDAVAAKILEGLKAALARRSELAQAVMGEMAPEMPDTDPNAFKKALRAYSAHLTRLNPTSVLWRYIGEKNAKGEALTFRNQQHTGRRAPKPGRRRGTLSYDPIKREAEDA